MALDLWFREDVARILAATQEAMLNSIGVVSAVEPEVAAAYQQGFVDALRAIAIAFGVVPLVGLGPAPRGARARIIRSGQVEASPAWLEDPQAWK